MPPASRPRNEEQRLKALRSYGILDTPPEAAFDDITRIAAHVCEAPIAVVNLIDAERQWFKSEIGLGVQETPLDPSICAHAILQPGLFVVPDTLEDRRFATNPLVTGDPHLRFYAGALLRTADGHALGTVCVLDYKPRVLSDAQQATLIALARQAMALLELRSAVSTAERLSRYRSRLMAVAGHDLKQPLQVISMVVDRFRAAADEGGRKRIELADKSIEMLSEGLDRLAEASRLDNDSGEPESSDFPVTSLLQAIILTWSQHAEQKGIRLRVCPSSAVARTDLKMLTTIVGNLVGNAIKYTQAGGVLVGCKRRGPKLYIEVLDTGTGIPPRLMDRIFEPFHQLDPEHEGLGLGLSIAQRTANLLGINLRVQSDEGKGSCFAVEVPLAPTQPR